MQHGFDPWPRDLYATGVAKKKKKKGRVVKEGVPYGTAN